MTRTDYLHVIRIGFGSELADLPVYLGQCLLPGQRSGNSLSILSPLIIERNVEILPRLQDFVLYLKARNLCRQLCNLFVQPDDLIGLFHSLAAQSNPLFIFFAINDRVISQQSAFCRSQIIQHLQRRFACIGTPGKLHTGGSHVCTGEDIILCCR